MFNKLTKVVFLSFPIFCMSQKENWECPSGTKLFTLKDGTLDCLFCSECPRGKVKVANCSEDHDTICEPCKDFSYYDDNAPHCRPCSKCRAGEFMKKNCSEFSDSVCEIYPNDTHSSDYNVTRSRNVENKGTDTTLVITLAIVLVVIAMLIAAIVGLVKRNSIWRYFWSLFLKGRQVNDEAFQSNISKDANDQIVQQKLLVKQDNGSNNADHTELLTTERKLSPKEQFEMLSSSVGVLVFINETEEDENTLKRIKQKLAVCFIGLKYIITAFFPLKALFGTTDSGDLNVSRFDDPDVYVTFDESLTSSSLRLRVRATEPAYLNDSLNVVVLEVYFKHTDSDSKFRKNAELNRAEQKKPILEFPPPLRLHTSVLKSSRLYFCNNNKRSALQVSMLETNYHALVDIKEQLRENALSLNSILRQQNKPDNLIENSITDLEENGKTKLFWNSFQSELYIPGVPGFIFEKDRYKLACICTGKFLKFMDSLPTFYKEQFKKASTWYNGSMMSALYTDMKKDNPDLANELFFV